ncbi:helix-turn-helix domain-containing protein [Mediterraneibacter massiliensis]|uniref:helix-turn-helix domain-containing protein n=1 Tax=Mediterraneibacter massiliensis TaxID=1720300 RepID=UPI00073E16C6|nr:helix-turn-helix transcriptional regulator [Mediterraneibacter massiliensis]
MYKKFEQLLRQNNVTPYRVHKETGISTATLSDWKNGKSEPKKDKIEKICQYFEVPLSYFYGEESEGGEKYYLNEETAQVAQEIFENKELRALFDVQKDMEPEDLKALHNMALALKRKERGDIDDTGC